VTHYLPFANITIMKGLQVNKHKTTMDRLCTVILPRWRWEQYHVTTKIDYSHSNNALCWFTNFEKWILLLVKRRMPDNSNKRSTAVSVFDLHYPPSGVNVLIYFTNFA